MSKPHRVAFTEGEYSSIGGKIFEGTDRETAVQETLITRRACPLALLEQQSQLPPKATSSLERTSRGRSDHHPRRTLSWRHRRRLHQ